MPLNNATFHLSFLDIPYNTVDAKNKMVAVTDNVNAQIMKYNLKIAQDINLPP